mgnify:CR=1 FL=1
MHQALLKVLNADVVAQGWANSSLHGWTGCELRINRLQRFATNLSIIEQPEQHHE